MLQSPSDARRVLGLDRIPDDLRVVARLLILWVDESEEDRARSLSAELRAPIRGLQSRRSEVRPLESRPMMRAPEAAVAVRLSKATHRRGGARIVHFKAFRLLPCALRTSAILHSRRTV